MGDQLVFRNNVTTPDKVVRSKQMLCNLLEAEGATRHKMII